MPKADKPAVSIVVPVYNEEESLPHLVRRLYDVMVLVAQPWELICVDDGSSDASATILASLQRDYPPLKPLYLRRNAGQTAAMQAGFDHAEGEIIVTIDADLQNDPQDIPRLLEAMERENADIVSGWRRARRDNAILRTWPSMVANRLISNVTGVVLHDYGCSLKAYRRELLEGVRIYGELHRFIPAVVSQYGAKVIELEVTHHARQFGRSKYGIDRTFRVILDLILVTFFLKYINRPMHAFGMTGLFCLVPGGFMLLYLTVIKLFAGVDIGDRPLLLLGVMLVLIGVQLIGMGVLGELLMRIYHEPGGRRQYALRKAPEVGKKRKS